MPNVIMPEQDVRYTFAFSPTKKMVYRWYGEYKTKQNGQQTGRLMLYNETTERYTDMTLSYFRYLCRRHLVEKMPIDCEGYDKNGMPVKKEKPKPPESKVKKQPEKTTQEELIECAQFYLPRIQTITAQEKYRLECEFDGNSVYNPEEISKDLKNIIKGKLSNEDKIDQILTKARRLENIISRYRADKPLHSSLRRIPL